ncbi:hypothetical protein FNV43_RR17639 [Rhamnella rubrinervis]|uniref:Ubiquitin-like protease family profile domain-containing protein n=1 Tax=Rhamnella rubrinervis TaxID=2594499 RepID=A0A8K0GS38_9ROSA|nr:hypothetical protein FNV43_RR17639 [Rhamnella rubrinervis]
MFDPFRPIPPVDRNALMTFLEDSNRVDHDCIYERLDKPSFQNIINSGGWLRDNEIDTILFFERRRKEANPQLFNQQCIIVDVMFWSWMWGTYDAIAKINIHTHPNERPPVPKHDWTVDIDDTLIKYVKGILPAHSSSWNKIDHVYVPVNCENKHWLAAHVDIPKRHVTLFDSNCAGTLDWFQVNNAESLGVLFPYLLNKSGFYDARPELASNCTQLLQPFSISRTKASDCPQQTVSGDCGVFMLKCIEYLSSSKNFDYGQDNIQFFREKYAVDIYHHRLSM